MRRSLIAAALVSLAGATLDRGVAADSSSDVVRISIVATTDLHGYVFPRNGQGGLALLGGYVRNLRAARAADGGAVLLVDSGDTFQGGIESDLSEGALVVDAYDRLGYAAAAIGNHEFDFGPVDAAGARQRLGTDPRGAIKARAAQAGFPFLAANLIDDATGKRVDWPNVRASTLVRAAGVAVGIVGVMSANALRGTLPVNVHGLRVAPLAETVAAEAAKLRAAGAELVIVAAHAGGACADMTSPADLSSCDASSEIFELAGRLPPGLVDVIAAGHTHQAVAHEVAGIAIVQAYALGRAFSRVDVTLERRTRRVVSREIFAPQGLCSDPGDGSCDTRSPGESRAPAVYEGHIVAPDSAIDDAMAPALERVRELRAQRIGVALDTPIGRAGATESALGNLFADAQRARTGAEVAINNNVRGGLRADLPAGNLTLGSLYDVFPFDNRLVTLELSGAELKAVFADEARRNRPGALGVSGVHVLTRCSDGALRVEVQRPSGAPVRDDERLVVAAMDSLVLGGVFAAAPRPPGFAVAETTPVMREVVEDWLRAHGGRLSADQFVDATRARWTSSGDVAACAAR